MDRLVILDTETTGLEVKEGHRIIEIGCIEIIDRKITTNQYHQYIQPNKNVGDSYRIHGISDKFLHTKPTFDLVYRNFLDFIKNDTLVIHNATFDMIFLNNELSLLNINNLENNVIDTIELSKKIHIGATQHNLDTLCRRYDIDISARVLHGALLDSQMLAEVYLAMTGGQKPLFSDYNQEELAENSKLIRLDKNRKPLKIIKASTEELSAHKNYFN